jgi:YVTN family beta-propeller protein
LLRFPTAALLAALCAAPLAAQSFSHGISLAGLGNGAPGRSFGIAYEPTQDRIFVAVCGDFLTPNDVVAVIDPATDTVVSTIQVGLFPEDIAFHYDALGNLEYGIVTDSTSGTLTVWDAALQPVATVALPDPFGFGSCYPFGLVVAGAHAWVGTVDGSGAVYAVDLGTLQENPLLSRTHGGLSYGRLHASNGELWMPASRYTPSFSGSGGGLARRPLYGAAVETLLTGFSDGASRFPAGQDLALLADGRAFLGGTWFDGRIQVLDADGELLRSIQTGGSGAQGLAVDAAETLLAAADVAADKVHLVDLGSETVLVEIGVGAWGTQPNDVLLLNGKLYVTCQGSEEILVFDNLPPSGGPAAHDGTLTVSDTSPAPGTTVQVDLTGHPGLPVTLLSASGLGGGSFQGLALALDSSTTLRATGSGSLTASIQVPARAALRGRTVFLQGVVDAGATLATTWPTTVVVQ